MGLQKRAGSHNNNYQSGAYRFADDRNLRPGLRIYCSECTGHEDVQTNIRACEVPQNFADRMFRNKGWAIGKDRRYDVCPKCQEMERERRELRRQENVARQKEEGEMEKVTAISPAQIVVRAPTPADRRKIFDAIEEASVPTGTGYKLGQSDESLCKALGLPKAWVAEVRQQMFGFADASDILREARGELLEITKEQEAIKAEIGTLADLQRALLSRHEECAKRVEVLRRKIGG